jgi:hypothetical protein
MGLLLNITAIHNKLKQENYIIILPGVLTQNLINTCDVKLQVQA